MGPRHLTALAVSLLLGAAVLVPPAQAAAPTAGRSCKTAKSVIAKQLRREDAFPVVRGMRARDVAACRGRWAVVTRPWPGDASFNAKYRNGRWRYHSGYPMGSCSGVPGWLCPSHP